MEAKEVRATRDSVLRDVCPGGGRERKLGRIDLFGLSGVFQVEAIAIALRVEDEDAPNDTRIFLLEQRFVDVEHDRIIMRRRFLGFAQQNRASVEFRLFVESEIERRPHAFTHQKCECSRVLGFFHRLDEHLFVFGDVDFQCFSVGDNAILTGRVVPKRHLVRTLEEEHARRFLGYAGDLLRVLLLEFRRECVFAQKNGVDLRGDQICRALRDGRRSRCGDCGSRR